MPARPPAKRELATSIVYAEKRYNIVGRKSEKTGALFAFRSRLCTVFSLVECRLEPVSRGRDPIHRSKVNLNEVLDFVVARVPRCTDMSLFRVTLAERGSVEISSPQH